MLQSSGAISIGDIRTEAGVSGTQSLNDLLAYFPQLDQSQPVPISRFYGATKGYTITWGLSVSAASGSMSITKNGVEQVSGGGGSFTVYASDSIYASVTSNASSPLIADATLSVVDNGTSVHNNTNSGIPTATDSYGSYNPTGNGSISGDAEDH